MPKVLRHLLLALFLIATQRVAQSGEVITPGVRHDEGGAQWTDSLRQWVTEGCVERYRAQGLPEICGDYYIGVQNLTAGVLHCLTTLDLSGPNEKGLTHIEQHMVLAANERSANASRGPLSSVPLSFASKCHAVPAIAAPMKASSDCPIEATLDNPDDFYPPGPIRRQETGETVIEFTADPGSVSARDIALVQTSGFVDLDSAAIRLGRALRISSSCASQRIRRSILFDMSLDPRDTPERGVGCLVVRPPAMVLVVPTDAR